LCGGCGWRGQWRYPRVISRRLVLHDKGSFVNTVVSRVAPLAVFTFRHRSMPDDHLALNPA
jgi:hypothetical protein